MSPARRTGVICALLSLACWAGAPVSGAAAATILPGELSQRVSEVLDGVTGEWTAHELSDGQLIDPVLGASSASYGQGMIGQAMVVLGASTPADGALVEAGLQAELDEVSDPGGGGFELLNLAEAYVWNGQHLGAAWEAAQPQFDEYLSGHGPIVSDAGVCYTTSDCYDNLKLVAAVAELELLRTNLGGLNAAALMAEPLALRADALAKLAAAANNTGDDASHSGTVRFTGAGILSDPNENPLAYHALSTLMLGRAVIALGAATPHVVAAAFTRAARALIGLMAPDGDVAYIGRGQGQVWTVAATIDALSLAAELNSDPLWRGRFLAGVQLALERLGAVYPRSGWGLPVVPRLAHAGAPINYLGVDGYANSVEYNGLALWALRDAAGALAAIAPTPAQPVPSQTEGTFLDPSHTRFAAVTHGHLWFAIHGTDSNLADGRYGFGLVAADLFSGSRWQPALPLRPLTSTPQVGGVALLSAGRTRYPIGAHMSATSGGEVRIEGRWSPVSGLRDPHELWVFRPAPGERGVVLSFRAPARASIQFEVFFEEGALAVVRRDGLHVREPNGLEQSYTINAPVSVRAAGIDHSAYVENLPSAIITVPASSRSRMITYTTRF